MKDEAPFSGASPSLIGGPLPGLAGGRDAIELAVAAQFQDVLELQDVGPETDFFEHGGTSFMAVQILAGLRRTLDQELTIADLVQAATVGEVAARIRAADALTPRTVVPLRSGGSDVPIYIVHALPGTVVRFVQVMRALPLEIPVYGLQSIGLEPSCSPHRSIPEMSRDYVAAIRQVQPFGPYRLAGYSMGGLVAHEMASQLQAGGQGIELVIALDTETSPHFEQGVDYALPILARYGLRLDVDLDELRSLPPQARLEFLAAEGRSVGSIPEDYDEARVQRMMQMYINNAEAISGYELTRLQVPLMLITSNEAVTSPEAWAPFVASVEHVHLDCDHFMLLEAPFVEEVGSRIAASLVQRAVTGR